ncbi:MAG TPA: GNAT family N-acetyltransferase, partial [Nitrosopumilaceae archaeon]|nr:GNAT family N-acetyltransferase [Nitrosopumilaceae archaeon]
DLEPVSTESKTKWFHEHNPTTRPLWIVEVDGIYSGWVSFQSFYGRPAYQQTAEISIYLEENVRGKGLGKICLQHALNSCPSLNIHTLLGFIFGHNETSLKLFNQLGFEKWAHLPEIANMEGIKRDLLILGRKVSEV